MTYEENPKTKGSGIVCCIPQNGRCPIAAAPRMLKLIRQVSRTQAQFSPEARELIKELDGDE